MSFGGLPEQDYQSTSETAQVFVFQMKMSDKTHPPQQNAEQVLAVFPDTTSFYRATVSKQPVRKAGVVGEVRFSKQAQICRACIDQAEPEDMLQLGKEGFRSIRSTRTYVG